MEELLNEKLSAIFIAFTLAFSSVGTVILLDDVQTVEAKSYKSGKKSYNNNTGSSNYMQNNDSEQIQQ